MFEQQKGKIEQRIILIIILLYIITAMAAVVIYGQSMYLGSLERYDNDDVKYIRSGVILAEKGILVYEDPEKSTVFIMPGLSYVLAAFFKTLGQQSGIIGFRIFQVLLQGASLYLLFLIIKKAFNRSIALLACVLDTLYMPELFSANLILMECIFKLLLLMLCYIGIAAVESRSTKHYAAAGAIWAAACYFRPTIALLPIVVLLLWKKYRYSLIDALKYGLLTAAVFILLMSPWWVRNYNLYHEFIPFTLSSGNPFLQGTYINYDQSKDFMDYQISEDYRIRDKQEKAVGIERLKKFGRKYPIHYIYWYTIGKTAYFWGAPFYWKNIFGIKQSFVQIYHYVILFAALIGLYKLKKRNIAIDMLLYLILYLNVIYLPFYTFSRYSYPIMGFVMAFAAHGVMSFQKSNKRSEVSL